MKNKRFMKILSVVLTVAMMLCFVSMVSLVNIVVSAESNFEEFAGGSGTSDDPYLIADKDHLNNVRFYPSSYFKLIDDIEFSEEDFSENGDFYNDGKGWEPIGYTTDYFSGTFDGDYHSIINLKISRNENNIGFFGTIRYGNVLNTYFDNIEISANDYVGGVAGKVDLGNVTGCYINGTITGKENVGGITGNLLQYGSITSCFVEGEIIGTKYVGGICGYVNPFSRGSTDRIAYIEECCNNAAVNGTSAVGGIVGKVYATYDEELKYVEGTYGGASYFKIVWVSSKQIYIRNCYNKGNVKSTGDNAGGIIGLTSGNAAPNKNYAGTYNSKAFYCYNSGKIESNSSLKGPIVSNVSNFDYSYCYYLNDTISGTFNSSGTAKTENQMKTQSSFSGYDFKSVWTMAGDEEYLYPELQNFILKGQVEISGNIEYEGIVRADISNVNRIDETFTYKWLVNGEEVGSGETYKIKADDVGGKLQVKVTGSKKMNTGSLYSEEYVVNKISQPESPIESELIFVNDNKIEISTVAEQEYSIDNTNWQSSGVFENLDPNREYIIYSRILENDLYFTGESKEVLKITTERRPLAGVVSISGTPRYNDTITVDVSGVLPTNSTYSYVWEVDGATVGTSYKYTIKKADIGKSVKVSIKGTGDFIGTLVSASVVATKTTVQVPDSPVADNITINSIKLVQKSGYEYSMDKTNWQDSPLFEGLSVATEYTFYQRLKETETTFASKVSAGVKISTLKNSVSSPEKPTIENVTNTSVTLKKIEGYEYSIDGLVWQKSNVFDGLNPNVEYAFCQRVAETVVDYASSQSGYVMVTTLKNTVELIPDMPTISQETDTSVILVAVDGYEYSIDGINWQGSNCFDNLTTLETYTFYQRLFETNEDYAGPISEGLVFKVKNIAPKPDSPSLQEVSCDAIKIIAINGYEYSIDSVSWSDSAEFTGLLPNTEYLIYCRILETDTHYRSEISEPLVLVTLKNTVKEPEKPVASEIKDDCIVLVNNDLYEYSIDGMTWQKSNVFENLSPNTEYNFYQRFAETEISYPSDKSEVLKVYTMKSVVSKPLAPTLAEKTANKIILQKNDGYEYSIDGETWQDSNEFFGLIPVTEYKIYQRIAETDITYASERSDALTVVTPDHVASEEIVENKIDPTCDSKGTYDLVVYCKVCHVEMSRTTVIVDQTGHKYLGVITEPTCLKGGYTTNTCMVCGKEYIDDITKALGHDYASEVSNPTCVTDGYTLYACVRCDYKYKGNIVTAHGHNYKINVIEPICVTGGYTEHICYVCDYNYNDNYTEATGHNYGEWVVSKQATCVENGLKYRVCAKCDTFTEGYRQTEIIEAFGHNYKIVVTEPTCIKNGFTTYICTVCDDTYTDNVVNAAGHDYISVVTKPTCTEGGFTTYNCTVCDDTYTDNIVDATGHNYVPIVTEPTCTEGGYTTYTCSDCGDSYIDNYVSALGMVKGVSVDDIALTYKNGTKLNPDIKIDDGVDCDVEFKSSNTSVATVDENGNVTATGTGTAEITVTVTDEYGNVVEDTCTVTVEYAWWQWLIIIFLFGWIWY